MRPRRWRSSTPRACASSSSVVGWRWAMPRIGQVGQHLAHRRVVRRRLPLPPRGHGLGHGPGLRPQRPGVLQLRSTPPRGRWRRSAGCAAPRTRPRPSPGGPSAGQLGDEAVVQLEQGGDVGGGVLRWAVGQRPAQPVGEPVALGRRDAELALQQRHQRRRAVADEAGGDLGVEQARAGPRRRRG